MERSGEEDSRKAEIREIETDFIAGAEIEQAALYYDMQRQGLGDEFVDEVERTMSYVWRNPGAYPIARGETRRANLDRFPYALLYRIEGNRILVVGCVHGKRDPSYWLPRT